MTASDRNGVADVFVRERDDARTEIVSVSSTGRAQDHSIAEGFNQVSDLSKDGRYVAFDADASTLVHNDRNHRTDVFVRDRVRKTTEIVSESNTGFEGDNDSFGPVITPNGRFVAYQSLASNLVAGNAKGEDTFVRDRKLGTTSIADVGATGARKGSEAADQPLQRPALSGNARVVAFGSTASNLVADDTNGTEDVFLRLMNPPKGSAKLRRRSGRATVALSADDPAATSFVCQADARVPYDCKAGTVRVPARHERVSSSRRGARDALRRAPPAAADLGGSQEAHRHHRGAAQGRAPHGTRHGPGHGRFRRRPGARGGRVLGQAGCLQKLRRGQVRGCALQQAHLRDRRRTGKLAAAPAEHGEGLGRRVREGHRPGGQHERHTQAFCGDWALTRQLRICLTDTRS